MIDYLFVRKVEGIADCWAVVSLGSTSTLKKGFTYLTDFFSQPDQLPTRSEVLNSISHLSIPPNTPITVEFNHYIGSTLCTESISL